jgi:2-hydroxy-6-oxo-6-(2'-carboxyphenyl)-hexa-2,4-dienoate hydrolase
LTPAELTPRLEDPLDQSKIHHVDVDGVRTRFYEEGAGEALVLLHGGDIGTIDSLDSWSLNLKGLAEHFHVYALDKLGAGHTGTPRSDKGFTYEAIVRHTAKWLDVVGVREAHLVGHSRGGLLAASLALSIPNLAKTTVIVNSASLAPDHPDPRLRSGTFYADIERRTPLGLPTGESVRIEPEANSHSTVHVTDEFIRRRLEIGLLPSQRDAVTRMRGGLNQEFYMPSMAKARMETLRAIDERGLPSRTLVVWSLDDRSAPLADVGIKLYERICAKTRHAEMHVFNAAAHYTYREHPGAFNRVIQSFCLGEGVGSRVAMSAKA